MENIKNELDKLNIMSSLDDTAELNRMMENYRNCPKAIKYLKDLGATDEMIENNIVKINDLVNDLNYCSNCPGIDNCKKSNPLLITKIVIRHGFIERELTPCKRVLEKMEIEKRFAIADFDTSWYANDLQEIDKTHQRGKVIMKYLSYLEDESDDWIFINGETNTGRSYLAASIAVDLARKQKGPLCYINAPLRFKELNDLSYSNKKRELMTSQEVGAINEDGKDKCIVIVRDVKPFIDDKYLFIHHLYY